MNKKIGYMRTISNDTMRIEGGVGERLFICEANNMQVLRWMHSYDCSGKMGTFVKLNL